MEIEQAQESREIVEAKKAGADILARAHALAEAITDSKSLAEAADYLLEIKRRRKWWADWNKPAKQRLDALKKELLERERQIDDPMESAEIIIKVGISLFSDEQERARKTEESRLRAEAFKRQEDERLLAAQNAHDSGEKEEAQRIIDEPIQAPVVVVPKATAPAGISYRQAWKFRVVDAAKVPREYLMLDESRIGSVVRAMKGETRIEGVEVYSENIVAGRA